MKDLAVARFCKRPEISHLRNWHVAQESSLTQAMFASFWFTAGLFVGRINTFSSVLTLHVSADAFFYSSFALRSARTVTTDLHQAGSWTLVSSWPQILSGRDGRQKDSQPVRGPLSENWSWKCSKESYWRTVPVIYLLAWWVVLASCNELDWLHCSESG